MPELVERSEIARKTWTRQEAHALVDMGFPNAEKLELIHGDLVDRMGKKHPHVMWQVLVSEWLENLFGKRRVRSEAPIDVATQDNEHNEPEPDLMVTKKSILEYRSTPPASEILLLIEISDSTLHLDLTVKAKLYARAEILEYWVIDILRNHLIVHRNPLDGAYTDTAAYAASETVSPLSAPSDVFSLAALGLPC